MRKQIAVALVLAILPILLLANIHASTQQETGIPYYLETEGTYVFISSNANFTTAFPTASYVNFTSFVMNTASQSFGIGIASANTTISGVNTGNLYFVETAASSGTEVNATFYYTGTTIPVAVVVDTAGTNRTYTESGSSFDGGFTAQYVASASLYSSAATFAVYAPAAGSDSGHLDIKTDYASTTTVYVYYGTTTVTMPVTCTLADSGSPSSSSFAFSVSSGSASPTTGSCSTSGSTTDVTVSPSVTLTMTVPSAGSNTRYQFSGGNSASTASCLSGTCSTFSTTAYYQLSQTYKASPGTPTTLTASITFPIKGTLLGTASSAICTITVPGSPSANTGYSCAGYADYDKSVSFPTAASGTGGSNWSPISGGTLSYSDTTGGNTHSLTYDGAFTLNNPQTLTIDYLLQGVSGTSSASSITVDQGSSFSVVAILTGTYTASSNEYVYQLAVNGFQILSNSSISSGPSQSSGIITMTIANGATVQVYTGSSYYVQDIFAASNSLTISASGSYYTASYSKTAAWEVDTLVEPQGGGGGGGGSGNLVTSLTSVSSSATTTMTTSSTIPIGKAGLSDAAAAAVVIALLVVGGVGYDIYDKRKYVH